MRWTVLVMLVLSGSSAIADAIVRTQAMSASTIAEIYVEDEFIRLELEIGLNDLKAFQTLLPDEIHQRMGFGNEPFPNRMQRFLDEQFVIVADDEPLNGILVHIRPSERVRRDEITGEPLPTEGEPQTVVVAEFVWPLESRPDRIDLLYANIDAAIGFVIYHKGVAVNDFRYLSAAQRLNLDWVDPWYSAFNTRSLRRQYYAPMAGFIYVEPYEVRKEIIARPKDLQRWVDLGLDGKKTIPVEMQADILQKASAFLAQHQPVTIDGKPAIHSLMRANFLQRSLRTSLVIDPPEELDVNSAIIGVIFIYPHEAFADSVTMEWDMFDERITIVPVAGVDPTGPLKQFLEPDFSTLEWQNFIRIPVMPTLVDIVSPPGALAEWLTYLRWVFGTVALMLAAVWIRSVTARTGHTIASGAAAIVVIALAAASWWFAERASLDDDATKDMVAGLLTNVYRAFDFRDESEVYDVLARSVDGALLSDVYLEMRRGLVLANQGGAVAKVKGIELLDIAASPAEDQTIEATTTWLVRASVGHWGHIHERRNQYQANLRLQVIDGAWKLVDLEIVDAVRL